MKIELLREFLDLAETLNFSASAQRLGTSQPVLSTHIKTLERELGVHLFIRDSHHVRLTDEGRIVYKEAREIVEHYFAMTEGLDKYLKSISSTLTIGYLYHAFKGTLPYLTRTYMNSHAEVDVRLQSHGLISLTKALADKEIDLALIIDVDESLHDYCNVLKLGEDRISCVVRADDPLASCETLSLTDLKTEAFILPHPEFNSGLARYYQGIFERAGYRPDVAMFYREIDTRHLDIEAGAGIALVGNHFQKAMGEGLRFIPLEEEYCKYDLVALWRKSNSNQDVASFLDMLRTAEFAC